MRFLLYLVYVAPSCPPVSCLRIYTVSSLSMLLAVPTLYLYILYTATHCTV